MILKRIMWILLLVPLPACQGDKEYLSLLSPDASYTFHLEIKEKLAYRVSWKGSSIIERSALGFVLSDGTVLFDMPEVLHVKRQKKHVDWQPVYGEQKEYPDNYNELLVKLSSVSFEGGLALRIRAYNEGVAFRYEIESESELLVKRELTEFAYPGDPFLWASRRAQSEIDQLRLSELSFIAERPLLAELSDTLYTAIGEAALVDFARMKFVKHQSQKNILLAALDKGEDDTYPITIPPGAYKTPWRYIMAGRSPAQILQNNYLLLNLNEENKLMGFCSGQNSQIPCISFFSCNDGIFTRVPIDYLCLVPNRWEFFVKLKICNFRNGSFLTTGTTFFTGRSCWSVVPVKKLPWTVNTDSFCHLRGV